MKWFLSIGCVLALLGGIGTCAASKSAIHEIQSAVCFLIAAVLLGAAAIREAVEDAHRTEHNTLREILSSSQEAHAATQNVARALKAVLQRSGKQTPKPPAGA